MRDESARSGPYGMQSSLRKITSARPSSSAIPCLTWSMHYSIIQLDISLLMTPAKKYRETKPVHIPISEMHGFKYTTPGPRGKTFNKPPFITLTFMTYTTIPTDTVHNPTNNLSGVRLTVLLIAPSHTWF